ncbi:sigma-70 family RNA polymerase sigma factor [Hymenobacter tibetensis]|uniref:Sigma-70 family RNA polymerase sigma factor n=1 Tax=Hymenobacter tibetensis TaxID=497967 RepID=A0ABY4CWF7_9BACT|nr:sigma-70 family RNA polymerase sigma factor [Hymenobacter tibetensis]UOG74372.1 sigma-70 family RNA polymerase sigma factor [Hymenobacter tibetensis]
MSALSSLSLRPATGLRGLLAGTPAPSTEAFTSPAPSVRQLTPPSQLSEAELIDGCLAGSRLMQKYLYERFSGRMMAVCLRYAQTTFEAEDVLQEGFITVFRNLGSFRRECPLEFWIRRIMVNAALRQHRRNAPLVAVSEGEYPEELADEEFTLANYGFEELLTMVQELAPRYRMVFNLFAVEGYGHKEIGEMLGISEGTSKSQYSRARAILKSKIERLDAQSNHGHFRT